jgi:hypothetical protein
MSTEEEYDLIFPRNRERYRTDVTSLPEIRGTMPTIIVRDEFVGVSPMVGPTQESLELIKKMKDQPK